MKSVVKKIVLGVLCAFAFIVTSLTLSCQIGLGNAVDTQRPILTISSPGDDDVTSGSITVTGAYTDDLGLKTLTFKLLRISNDSSSTVQTVTVSQSAASSAGSISSAESTDTGVKGTWSVNLDTTDFLDGTYKIVVTGNDGYFDSQETTRTFDIDNTEPVVLMTKPNSVSMSDPASYGSVVTVSCTIADDHDIKQMKVHVYNTDSDGNITDEISLAKDTFTGFDVSGGTSVVIASSSSTDEDLANNYSAIYENKDSSGDCLLGFALEVTDKAGNTSEWSYISSDLISAIEDATGETVDSSTIKKIYNETYDGMSSKNLSRALAIMKNEDYQCGIISDDSVENALALNVNSDASPKYEFLGSSVSSDDEGNLSWTQNSYSNNKITVQLKVSAGLDGTLIRPSYSEDDGLGIKAVHVYSCEGGTSTTVTDDDEVTGLDIEITYGETPISELNTSVDYQFYTVTIGTGLKGAKYYILTLEGTDLAGREFTAQDNNAYGFQVSSNYVVPTVSSSFVDEKIYRHEEFYDIRYDLCGIIDTDSYIDTSNTTFGLTVSNKEDSSEASASWTGLPFTFYKSVSELISAESITDESIKTKLTEKFGSISNKGIAATEDGASGEYIWMLPTKSKLLELASDASTVLANIRSDHSDSATSSDYSITSSLNENGGATYRIAFSGSFYNQSTSGHQTLNYSLTVDTHSPTVAIKNISPIVSSESNYLNGKVTLTATASDKNLSDVNLVVFGTIDGSDSEKIKITNTGDIYSFTSDSIDTTKFDENTNFYFAFTGIDEAGNKWTVTNSSIYAAEINDSDENRASGWGATDVSSSYVYVVDQSTDAPVISLTNADSSITDVDEINTEVNLFGTTSNNKLLGTITDDDGVESVTVKYRKAGSTGSYTTLLSKSGLSTTSYPLSVTLPSDEGEYEIQISVQDTADETGDNDNSTSAFVIAVDAGSPVIGTASFKLGDESFTNNGSMGAGQTLTLEAAVKEASSVDEDDITCSVTGTDTNGDEITVGETITLSKALSGSAPAYTFTGTVVTGETLSDGTYTATFTLKDKYEQESSTSVAFVVDATRPEFELLTLDSTPIDSVNTYLQQDSTFTFAGNASDEGSGLSAIQYWFDTETAPSEVQTGNVKTGNTWNAVVTLKETSDSDELLSAGSHTIYFRAVDAAGNSSSISSFTFTVDADTPSSTLNVTVSDDGELYSYSSSNSGTFTEVSLTDSVTQLETGSTYYTTQNFILSGVISEENIDAITATLIVDGDVQDESGFTLTDSAWTFETTDGDAEYLYRIVIVDKSGRQVSYYVTVVVDTVAPSISISTPSSSDSFTTNSITIRGTHEDEGSGIKSIQYSLDCGANYTDVTTIGGSTWSATGVSLGSTQGSLTLLIKATDKIGHTTTSDSITFYYDEANPELSITTPTSTTGTVTNKTFTIAGTASDTNALYNSGSGAVVIVATDTSDSTNTKTFTLDVEDGSWSVDIPVGSSSSDEENYLSDAEYLFAVTVTDAAEKTTSKQVYATLDTTSPTASAGIVSKAEDSTSGVDSVTVGEEIWYGSSSIPVRVTASDTLSGLKGITYSTVNSEETVSSGSLTNGSSYWTGNVGVSSGTNVITFCATDNAGNSVTTTLSVNVDVSAPETVELVTVDGVSDVTSKLVNGKNSITVALKVSDANTGVSGVSFTKIGSTAVTEAQGSYDDDEESGTYGYWVVTIPSASLTASGSATFTATDGVGNSQDYALFTLTVDSTPPTVTVTSPTDADSTTDVVDVNGTISLSGTAQDDNSLSSVDALYYTTSIHVASALKTAISSDTASVTAGSDAATGWVLVSTASLTGTTSWTASGIVTSVLDGTNSVSDSTTVYVTAKATDSAGNSGYASPITLRVDQNTDRPKVVVTTATLLNNSTVMSSSNRIWVTSSTLSFTTIDDDGTVSSVRYSFDNSEWVTPSLVNGSGTVSFSSDGETEIYFEVTDSASKKFTSSSTNSTSAIYLTDGTNSYGNSTNVSSIAYLTVDTNAPTVGNLHVWDESLTTPAWSSDTTGYTFGGDYDTIDLYVTATDTNGIASVTATYSGLKDSSNNAITGTVVTRDPVTDTENAAYGEGSNYLLSGIPCDTGTGTISIVITAKDNAGKTGSVTYGFAVDNTSPVIYFSSPSSTQTSSGSITATGTVDSTSTVYYALSPSSTVSPDTSTTLTSWTSYDSSSTTTISVTNGPSGTVKYTELEDASLSWTVYFDGDTSNESGTHSVTMNTYLVNWGITTETALSANDSTQFSTIVEMYLWIKSVDEVGNSSESCHLILLDPQGDRPNLTYSYPESNGTSLGGTVRVAGSASDNGTVKRVWLQLISDTHEYDSGTVTDWSKYKFGTYTVSSSDVSTFSLTEDDLDYLANAGYSIYNRKTYASETTPLSWTCGSSVSGWDDPDSSYTASIDDFAILTTLSSDGSTWYQKINQKSEFNPASGKTNTIVLCAYAEDNDGKFSTPQYRYGTLDSDNPIISDLYLVQASSIGGTVTASVQYSADMYVKGEWYLTGTVTDSDAIQSLTINGDTLVNKEAMTNTDSAKAIGNGSTSSKTISDGSYNLYSSVSFWYKLDTDSGLGTLSFSIEAEDAVDGTTHTGTQAIVINYDNTPPCLVTPDSSSYNLSPNVQQDDGFYTFGSVITENTINSVDQSGVDYVAFYFMRRDTVSSTKSNKLFNPMYSTSSTYNSVSIPASTGVSALGSETTTTDNTIVYDRGMYWLRKAVTRSSDELNVLGMNDTSQVAVGSLINIGGAIYTVDSYISNSTVTISGSPMYSSESDIAYVALAMVVNNTTTESSGGSLQTSSTYASSYGYGYYSSPTNDDGDLMVEKLKASGTSYTWEANIFSRNITDGPIELHYIAFDRAGNYSIGVVGNASFSDYMSFTGTNLTSDIVDVKSINASSASEVSLLYVDSSSAYSYVSDGSNITYSTVSSSDYNDSTHAKKAFVSNNAPRLANISVGTDLDGNGAVSATETSTAYETSYTWSSKKTSLDAGSSTEGFITAKGMTVITPEILGGNGSLYYSYAISNSSGTSLATGENSTAFITGTADGEDGESRKGTITMQLGDFLNLGTSGIADTASSSPHLAKFTVWDSTEGTTALSTSQSADVNVYMGVSLRDGTEPEAYITPFYWNSINDNSIYGSSSLKSSATVSSLSGHIELEADIASASSGMFSSSNSDEWDLDPKVSGGIVISGTISDNIRLGSVYVSIPGMESLFSSAGLTKTLSVSNTTFYQMATFDSSTSTWSYNGTTAVNKDSSYSTYGFKFVMGEDSFSSSGHIAEWTLSWNTALISGVAEKDVIVQIVAVDQGTPSVVTGSAYTSVNGSTQYAVATYASAKNSSLGSTNTTTSTQTPYYKMDVVPYITGISTTIRKSSGLKDNNIRAASGKYSVIAGGKGSVSETKDFITVSGFNLNPSSVALVNSKSVTSTSASGQSMTISTAATSGVYTSFTLTNASSYSGYLEVYVNGMRCLNNVNNNDSCGSYTEAEGNSYTDDDYAYCYNREPDTTTTKNVLLTDDRYLRFFSMKDTKVENGYYPVMVMNGDNPVFGYVDNNGGPSTAVGTAAGTGAGYYYYSNAHAQRAEFNGSTAAEVYTEYLVKQLATEQMGMAVDKGGRYYNVTLFNYADGALGLYYDRYQELSAGTAQQYGPNAYVTGDLWGPGTTYSNYNGSFAYTSGNNAITLERVDYNDNLKLNRYEYPKLVTTGNSKTGTAVVYMSYFDNKTNEILFRNFQIGQTVSGTATALNSSGEDSSGITYAQKYNFTENTSNSSKYSTGRLSVVSTGSKYFDMGVTSDNHVVIVYVDSSTNKLVLKYSTNAVDGSSPTNTVAWTTSSVSFPENITAYVSMALNGDEVHIAAFDSYDSNLVYMYLPSYSSTSLQSVTVDQASSVGNWTQIKVQNNIPYIAYYNATETGGRDAIKLAYAASSITGSDITVPFGVDVKPGTAYGSDGSTKATGYTTGSWEYMTVPAIEPPQGGDPKFQNVCLDFDSSGIPVVGYLGTNIEFGSPLSEQ